MTTSETPFVRSRKKWEPRSEQIRGLKLLVTEGGVRLFLPPGKGKTATVLKAFDVLRAKGFVDCLLVLAPLRVVTTSWPQELEKWTDFDHLKWTFIHGGPEGRQEAMDAEADVYLMNVEGLNSSEWKLGPKERGYPCNPKALKFLEGKKVMLVVDESTKFKNHDSKRYKTLKKYLPFFYRRVILTGTPQPNKLEDLFSQCYLTDMGDDLGPYITHFRHEHMTLWEDGKWRPLPGSPEKVAEKIAHCTLQLEDTEAVPITINDIWVKMPPEAFEKYEELRKHFLTEIEGKTVMSANAGVLFGQLRQLAQGAIYRTVGQPDDGYITLFDGKVDAVENLLEELQGEPMFLLYAYKHDLLRLNARLGYAVPYIGSGTTAAQGAQWCRAFSAGAIPLLGGHPQSVAHGVDGLQQNCHHVCWMGGDPSWENVYQANRRIARFGTEAKNVFVHRILTDCSVERAILSIVENKRAGEEAFLSELRKYLVY